MSFSLFLALPAPFKVVVVIVGFFLFGVNVSKKQVEVERAAQAHAGARIVPADKPAKVIQAVPLKPAKALASMIIMVNSDGSFSSDGVKLTEAQLLKKLKATAAVNPQAKVELKADALTPYQMVVNAVKISKAAGLTNVSFASKSDKP